jgi:hypothetical protein
MNLRILRLTLLVKPPESGFIAQEPWVRDAAGSGWLGSLSHIRAMKNMRAFLTSFLLVAGICVFAGCATTSPDSNTATNDSTRFEKKQPSPTEDMNAVQKTGYYLGLFSLDSLYLWAASDPSFSP